MTFKYFKHYLIKWIWKRNIEAKHFKIVVFRNFQSGNNEVDVDDDIKVI